MAATLVLSDYAKGEVVKALKEDLTHAFLGKETANINLLQSFGEGSIEMNSSDGSSRVKQLRINAITTEYRTENDLQQNDESRITNFYIVNGTAVNKLVLMNSANTIHGIITFPTITPTETKSLYIPEIKINVL